MKRRQLSPLLDRTSGHHEARLLVREAEDRGLLLGRSLFFSMNVRPGVCGLGRAGESGTGARPRRRRWGVGKGMEELQWLLEF